MILAMPTGQKLTRTDGVVSLVFVGALFGIDVCFSPDNVYLLCNFLVSFQRWSSTLMCNLVDCNSSFLFSLTRDRDSTKHFSLTVPGSWHQWGQESPGWGQCEQVEGVTVLSLGERPNLNRKGDEASTCLALCAMQRWRSQLHVNSDTLSFMTVYVLLNHRLNNCLFPRVAFAIATRKVKKQSWYFTYVLQT